MHTIRGWSAGGAVAVSQGRSDGDVARRRWPRTAALAVLLLGLAACAEQAPTAPTAAATRPRASLAPDQQFIVQGSYIVSFQGPGTGGRLSAEVAAAGGSLDLLRTDAGIALISGLPDSAFAAIAALPGITSMMPDRALPVPGAYAVQTGTAAPAPASAANPTQAFLYPWEWWLRAVQADVAWAHGVLGTASTHVAILDSGIDYTLPDLAGRVDLARSASFVRPVRILIPQPDGSFQVLIFSEADTIAKYFPGRNPVTDLGFHGTWVASIVSSNASVLAGVTSGLSLSAVKVCSYLFCFDSGIIRGILYAVDQGVAVANISLGAYFLKNGIGPSARLFQGAGEPPGLAYLGYYNSLMTYALSKGVTTVVAAGNSGIDLDHDQNGFAQFCSRPGLICVSATGPTSSGPNNDGPFLPSVDLPAFYSNYGRSAIDLAAPGGNLTLDAAGNVVSAAWIWSRCSSTSMILPICQTTPLLLGGVGTSFASPHVAAAAALVVERVGRNPALVRARLEQTADDLGQVGQDPFYGHGRLNVARAVGVIP